MAPPQAHQTDKLVRVGKEGFDLLEQLYNRPKKHGGRLPSDQACDVRHQVRHQAAQFFGGRAVVDHCDKKYY